MSRGVPQLADWQRIARDRATQSAGDRPPRPTSLGQALLARGDDNARRHRARHRSGARGHGRRPRPAHARTARSPTSCPASSASCSAASSRARSALRVGDTVVVITPQGRSRRPARCRACKSFTVVGTFDAGHVRVRQRPGAGQHRGRAAAVPRSTASTGVRFKLDDLYARAAGRRASCGRRRSVARPRCATGRAATRNWFRAVQIEKRMMFIILTLIVAVAAFNLVSTLVMTVTDKQRRHRDPAHARRVAALGHGDLHGAGRADRASSARSIGVGSAACCSRSTSTSSCRRSSALLHVSSCRQAIYYISRPAVGSAARRHRDRSPSIALVLALLATLYPSWRAARVNPAEALRYE